MNNEHPRETATVQRKRRPWLAFALGLVIPGLGQLYAGRPLRALAVPVVLLAVIVPAGMLIRAVVSVSPAGVVVSLILSLFLFLLLPFDAALVARSDPTPPMTRFNRVWAYVLI